MHSLKKNLIAFIIINSLCLALNNTFTYGQSLKDAIRLTDNEQFEKASTILKNLIKSDPQNGDNYFYLGENYLKSDNLDSAKTLYQQGRDVNASNPINYVGLGKVQWYQDQAVDAKANFYKAVTLSQSKNATVLLKIAEAYIQIGRAHV